MLNKTSLYYCVIRLVIIPLFVLAGGMCAGLSRTVVEITTVLAGMPAPLTTAILASKYEKNEAFAVSLVFVSTVFSIFTVPALSLLMMFL